MASYNDHIAAEVTKLVEPICTENALELVEVTFRQEHTGWVLRIIIYRKSGITVDDCVLVSREVSHLLDVEDLIPQKFNLEVSSPGLDRPLKSERDYIRNMGEKVSLAIEVNGDKLSVVGLIKDVDSGLIFVDVDGDVHSYPLEQIKKARLVIEF